MKVITKFYAATSVEELQVSLEAGFAASPGEVPEPDDNDLGNL